MADARITYIGGPTALIEIGGWRLLTDPTFDPPGKRYFFGWGTMSRKQQGPALAFAALEPVDAVLLSHDHHGDNLDPAGRAVLPRAGRVVTTVPAASRLGGSAVGLAPWEVTTLSAPGKEEIVITATPCRHGPPGSRPIVGAVIGFSLRLATQVHGELWISGDTVLYPGVREVARRLDVGTAIVHLGGVRFWWLSGPARYTMTAADAVELCEALAPETIVPIHFEGWQHFREQRAAAEQTFAASPLRSRVRFPVPGQPLAVTV